MINTDINILVTDDFPTMRRIKYDKNTKDWLEQSKL